MAIREMQTEFEKTAGAADSSALLTFRGVDGCDVYNASVPFLYHGRWYLYGRIERRDEWACSQAGLFRQTGPDEWTLAPGVWGNPIEDPCVARIGGRLVLAGTYVIYRGGRPWSYMENFYRGPDPKRLRFFTTGPLKMKDIRLVELEDGRIGVFSRKRGRKVAKEYGTDAIVGYTVIDRLEELTPGVVDSARPIPGLFGRGEWGGCNQIVRLGGGLLGVIGHAAYRTPGKEDDPMLHYVNVSWVFDTQRYEIREYKVLATRKSYPPSVPKRPGLADCAFASGIVARADGRCDLYSGVGDCREGRVLIDNPFKGFGEMENLVLG